MQSWDAWPGNFIHSCLSFTHFGGKEEMVAPVGFFFFFSTNLFSKLPIRDGQTLRGSYGEVRSSCGHRAGCWAR